MNEIYWITRLDLISKWLTAFDVISISVLIASIVGYFVCRVNSEDCLAKSKVNNAYSESNKEQGDQYIRWMKFWSRITRISLVSIFILLPITILTPTTKDAFLIYGLGSTIDYLKTNDIASELPDKCMYALNKWVDLITEDETSRDK